MPFDAGLQLLTLHGPQIGQQCKHLLEIIDVGSVEIILGMIPANNDHDFKKLPMRVHIVKMVLCSVQIPEFNKVYTELHGNPAHVVSVSSVETILVPHALIRCLSQTTLTRSQKLLVWHSVQVWELIIHSERSSVRYNSSTGNKVTSRRIPY